MELKCKMCGKNFSTKDKRRKFCSVNCYVNYYNLHGRKHSFKKGDNSGVENNNWKGNNVKICALHQWVYYYKGKPEKCVDCGATSKKLQWSNIDHKYRRNLDDYVARCSSCHKLYDRKLKPYEPWNKGKPMSDELRKKVSQSCKGRTPWNKGKILPFYPHINAIGRIPWNKGIHWKKGIKSIS